MKNQKKSKPIAILPLGNNAGILIYQIKKEKIAFTWMLSGKIENLRETNLFYDRNNEAYFFTEKKKYYLKDFSKVKSY